MLDRQWNRRFRGHVLWWTRSALIGSLSIFLTPGKKSHLSDRCAHVYALKIAIAMPESKAAGESFADAVMIFIFVYLVYVNETVKQFVKSLRLLIHQQSDRHP